MMGEQIVAEAEGVTCPRCGSEAPWLDRSHDVRVEAVMQAAVAVCAKKARVQDLDVLRAAVEALTAPPTPAISPATSSSRP